MAEILVSYAVVTAGFAIMASPNIIWLYVNYRKARKSTSRPVFAKYHFAGFYDADEGYDYEAFTKQHENDLIVGDASVMSLVGGYALAVILWPVTMLVMLIALTRVVAELIGEIRQSVKFRKPLRRRRGS